MDVMYVLKMCELYKCWLTSYEFYDFWVSLLLSWTKFRGCADRQRCPSLKVPSEWVVLIGVWWTQRLWKHQCANETKKTVEYVYHENSLTIRVSAMW